VISQEILGGAYACLDGDSCPGPGGHVARPMWADRLDSLHGRSNLDDGAYRLQVCVSVTKRALTRTALDEGRAAYAH